MTSEQKIRNLLEHAVTDFERYRERGTRCCICAYRSGRGISGTCRSCLEHADGSHHFRWQYADDAERVLNDETGKSDS